MGQKMEIAEAIRHALDGRAVLFLGAGFSCDAINVDGEKLPTGKSLASLLQKQLGLVEEVSLDVAADMFRDKYSEFSLVKLLQQQFTVESITPAQREFGRVPWRRVYTTNYDAVIENAFQECDRDMKSVSLSSRYSDLQFKKVTCVHINGFIEDIISAQLPDDFILTNSAYLADRFQGSGWAHVLREDISLARAVLFIGYSVYDLRAGSGCLNSFALEISGFLPGFLCWRFWDATQGGRSPTGAAPQKRGEVHAAALCGR